MFADDEDDVLRPEALRPDETVTYRWPAPGGRGLLTSCRLLLVTHPRPVHRMIRWSLELQEVTKLDVEVVNGPESDRTFGGPEVPGRFGADHAVLVNDRPVLIGDPRPCADLQARIDDARTARCIAVLGHLVPYTGAYTMETRPTPSVASGSPPALSPGPADQAAAAPDFLLFVAGVPYYDLGGSRSPAVLSRGGPIEPSPRPLPPEDPRPGQAYGSQAEIGRLVLAIARQARRTVQVIDVDRSGPDLALVQRYVGPVDDLPLLIPSLSQGRRLMGDAAFTPQNIERFLARG